MKATILLFTYNHERYIRECLESVLASDFEPLEIYIWDNCSTDGTANIIRKILAGYSGLHEVLFHQSEYNYHPSFVPMNTAMEQVRGEYIVFISGDDYQVPHRVSTTIEAMRRTGAGAVSSSVFLVGANGEDLGQRNRLDDRPQFKEFFTAKEFASAPGSPVCFGAALAWHRSVFDRFGPLREGPRNADVMIPFRGALLGGNYYIRQPLVYRRLHENTISLPEARRNSVSETEELLIKERQLSNRLANFVRMTEDAIEFRSMTRRKWRTDAIIGQMRGHVLRISSRWVRHRSTMAQHGIGIS